MKTLDYIFIGASIVLSLGLVLVALFNFSLGLVYDTDHFADTFFILGAAWRVLQGFEPVVDFGHFYGGFISETLSWTMMLFGDAAPVIYAWSLLICGFLIACAALMVGGRISALGFCALVVMVLACMLTRHPLEQNSPVIQIVSTHSFIYNRFAQAAMIVTALFVALQAPNRRDELLGGLIAGLLVGAVCLSKPTFIVVLPGLFLALLIARRWSAGLAALLGLVAFFLLFDPTLARLTGAFDYALAHVGETNGVGGLIRKTVQILLAQPVAFGLGAVALLLCLQGRETLWALLSIAVFAGAVVAMTATMGGNGSLGQLALPTLAGLAIGCAELARQHTLAATATVRTIAMVLVLGFATPHVLNTAAAATEATLRTSERLIEDGPYARYLSLPENADRSLRATQYERLADGITSLRSLGDPAPWGIVANDGMSFEHALRAKPVTGYPLWQRETAPELAPSRPLSDEVDVVLISRIQGGLDTILRAKLTADFSLCTVSEHWEIHVHQRLGLTSCSEG